MEFFPAAPAWSMIAATFLLILLLHRAGLWLGASLIINSIFLAFWSGAGTAGFLQAAGTLVSLESILLFVVIFLLVFFSAALKTSGAMDSCIAALIGRQLHPQLLLGGMPALIGLLPMPGGALVSAPMVEAMDGHGSIRPVRKAVINYWFRHIWEYWWPLYPGVILALRYAGLPLPLFILAELPLTLWALLGGYTFLLRGLTRARIKPVAGQQIKKPSMVFLLAPLATLIGISVVFPVLLRQWGGLPEKSINLLAVLIGLFSAIGMVVRKDPAARRQALTHMWTKKTFSMAAVVVGVLLFSAVLRLPLEQDGATVVMKMRDELLAFGIPLVIVILAVPFVSGLVTGIAIGFVGASFPIVYALAGDQTGFGAQAALLVSAYGAGFLGMMLSPLHICFVVTSEFFATTLWRAYRYLVPPVAVVACGVAVTAGLYLLLQT